MTTQVAATLRYRPDVDGLRAIAILAVMCFHAAPNLMTGGFTGVDVFFVISGYLISGILLVDIDRGNFSFLRFYTRRVRRLFPAFILTLCSVWILGWLLLLPDELQEMGKHMAAAAGFSLNLLLYKDTTAYFSSGDAQLTHLWSLGVEEQFYFFWPLFLFVVLRIWKSRFIWIALAVTVLSFLLNIIPISWNQLASFYLPWSRLWELSLGGLLAYVQLHRGNTLQSVLAKARERLPLVLIHHGCHIVGLIGALSLVISFSSLTGAMHFPGWRALIPSAGALLLISAGPRSWINRFLLSSPIAVYIGLISYPLYLWHWPLLSFMNVIRGNSASAVTTAAVVATSFALAALTYRYIELPVRRSVNIVRTASTLVTVVLACGVIGYLTFSQRISARQRAQEVGSFAMADKEAWLLLTKRSDWTVDKQKFITLGNGQPRTLFIGDSFMGHYIHRVARVLPNDPDSARSAVFAVRGGCPPMFNLAIALDREECERHVRRAIEYAENEYVDTVVLGALWTKYLTNIKDGEYGLIPNADAELEQVRKMILEFRRNGKRVYIILTSPANSELDPRRRIERTITSPGFRVRDLPAPTRAEIEEFVGPVASKLIRLANETGASVIDPMKTLCTEEVCPVTSSSGEPIYSDFGHLRPSYSRESALYLDETVMGAKPRRPAIADKH